MTTWRLFNEPSHNALRRAARRLFAWVTVHCDCGRISTYRSRRLADKRPIEVRCGRCGAITEIARAP